MRVYFVVLHVQLLVHDGNTCYCLRSDAAVQNVHSKRRMIRVQPQLANEEHSNGNASQVAAVLFRYQTLISENHLRETRRSIG